MGVKTFRHGGKIGDCIYALPTIRELDGGILYLPERTPDACNNLYSSLKDLLLQQPYIKEVREYPSGLPYGVLAPEIHIDYDLDQARNQPLKGVIHIVKRYMNAFGVNYPGWKEPWLKLENISFRWSFWQEIKSSQYVLINYTGRHIMNDQFKITSKVDWNKILKSLNFPYYFVGHKDEWEAFCKMTETEMPYLRTGNILEVALLMREAQAIYCNQSACVAIAQGLGKTYFLEPKPMKRNCLLETPNENILQ